MAHPRKKEGVKRCWLTATISRQQVPSPPSTDQWMTTTGELPAICNFMHTSTLQLANTNYSRSLVPLALFLQFPSSKIEGNEDSKRYIYSWMLQFDHTCHSYSTNPHQHTTLHRVHGSREKFAVISYFYQRWLIADEDLGAGFTLPIEHSDVKTMSADFGSGPLYTLRELRMMAFMDAVADNPSWTSTCCTGVHAWEPTGREYQTHLRIASVLFFAKP